MKYMLDTNIFNALLDGVIEIKDLPPNAEFVVTAMQLQEINKTKNEERRALLLKQFHEIAPDRVPTSSSLWNVTSWGEGCYGESKIFREILELLNLKNNSKKNNYVDALIAETALTMNVTLITSDRDLVSIVSELDGLIIFHEYL